MLEFCNSLKSLSKCRDKKTAAILCSKSFTQVYSIGINGGPKGGINCMCADKDNKHKYTCVHAEMNALVKNKTYDTNKKILICTKQPCEMCAALIVNSEQNITEVWYDEPYMDATGLEILREAGIETHHYHLAEELV